MACPATGCHQLRNCFARHGQLRPQADISLLADRISLYWGDFLHMRHDLAELAPYLGSGDLAGEPSASGPHCCSTSTSFTAGLPPTCRRTRIPGTALPPNMPASLASPMRAMRGACSITVMSRPMHTTCSIPATEDSAAGGVRPGAFSRAWRRQYRAGHAASAPTPHWRHPGRVRPAPRRTNTRETPRSARNADMPNPAPLHGAATRHPAAAPARRKFRRSRATGPEPAGAADRAHQARRPADHHSR